MQQPTLGKLFVGNLPVTTSETDVQTIFSQYGTIAEVALLKPNSRNVRGGFVRFLDQKSAEDAIAALNGVLLPGATIALVVRVADGTKQGVVSQNFALPLQQYSQATIFAAATNGTSPPAENLKVFVGNVPPNYTNESLQEMFASFGPVAEVAVLPVNSTGVCGAMIKYMTREAAESAIASMHGLNLPGSVIPLQVRYADSKKQVPGAPQAMQLPQYAQYAQSLVPPTEVKLFVGNLPLSATKELLASLFQPYGGMIEAFLFARGSTTGKCGFVRYNNADSAHLAITSLNGQSLDGVTNLVVRVADTEKRNKANTTTPLVPSAGPQQVAQLQQLSQQIGALIQNIQSSTTGPTRNQWPQAAPGFKPY
jgi:RNA recognition motif-containing protein